MRAPRIPAFAAFALTLATAAVAAPLPEPVARMIEAAADDKDTLDAVVKVARATHPDSQAEIDAQVAAIAARREAARLAALSEQGLFDGWSGEGQVGGFLSTGNSEDLGVSLGLKFASESLRWRHRLEAATDYQRSRGRVSKERYFAGYAGERKLGARAFVSVGLSAERDRFAGFRRRTTESLNLGYRLLDGPTLTLDAEAGPALRQTDYVGRGDESTVAVRAAADLAWTLTEDTRFTQAVQIFGEADNSTLTSSSALTTRLAGAVSARASFDVRHETDPPGGREKTDTTSRVTLVYGF
jgi:putative salt-induced outer membrane protein